MNYANWNKKLVDRFFPEGSVLSGKEIRFNLVDGQVLKIIAPEFSTITAAAADFICACADEFTASGQINVYAGITKALDEQQPPEYGIGLFCFFSLVWQYEIDEGRSDQYYPRVKECIRWANGENTGRELDDSDFCDEGNEANKGMNQIPCLLQRISNWAKSKGVTVPVESAGPDIYIGYPRFHAEKIWSEIADLYEKFARGKPVEPSEEKYRGAWEESGFGCSLEWTVYNGLKLKPNYPSFLTCEYLEAGTWRPVTYDSVSEKSEAVRFCRDTVEIKKIEKKDYPPKIEIDGRSFLYFRNDKWHFCENGELVNVRDLVITGSLGRVSVRSVDGREQEPYCSFEGDTYAEYDLRGLIGNGGDLLIEGQETGLRLGFDPTIIVTEIRYSDLKCRGCEVLELDHAKTVRFHYSGEEGNVRWRIDGSEIQGNGSDCDFELKESHCNRKLTVYAGTVRRTFVFVLKNELNECPVDGDCVVRGVLKYSCGDLILEKKSDKVLWGWRANRQSQIEDINQRKSFIRESLTGQLVCYIPEGMEYLMCGEQPISGNLLALSMSSLDRWGRLQIHSGKTVLADLDLIPTAPCFCRTGQELRLFFPEGTDKAAFWILKVTDNLQANTLNDCFSLISLADKELKPCGNDSWQLYQLPEEALCGPDETEPTHQGGVRLFLCEGQDECQAVMAAIKMRWTPDEVCTKTVEVRKPGEQFDFLAMRGKLNGCGIPNWELFAPIFARQHNAYDILKKRFETENLLLRQQTVVQRNEEYSAEQVRQILENVNNVSPVIQLDDRIPEEIRNYFTSLPKILKKNITRSEIPGLGELFPETDDNSNFRLRDSMRFVIGEQDHNLCSDWNGSCLFQFEGGILRNEQDELQVRFNNNRIRNHNPVCHLEIIDEDNFKAHLVDDCDVDTRIGPILSDETGKQIEEYAKSLNNPVCCLIREAFSEQPTNKRMIVYAALLCCQVRRMKEQRYFLPEDLYILLRKAAAAFFFHDNEKVRKLFVSELLGTEFFLTWVR